jgi:tRNA A-37 threonylcarbamoyl transferase component Bud32
MKLSENAVAIKKRHNKVVYRDGDRIVKVFNSAKPAVDVFNEALNLSRIQGTGILVPKILEVSQMDDGSWALSTEYIPGTTLGELFDKADGDETAKLLDTFIDLQVKIMHEPAPALLNKQRNKLAGMIGRVKEIDPSTRYDLQMRTDRMRGHHDICHGDYSPSNVIVAEDGNLYVCDWTHVTQGLAAADAATTYCILKGSRHELADAYLDAYSIKTDTPKQIIDYWVPVVAAAELARGREREHDILLTFIEGVADYE